MIQGLHFLQSKGICHRDLSLENILVDEDNCLVIDFGMCLRVPYSSSSDRNLISDVTNGSTRRLIKPMGTCGKHNYMSPEIFQNKDNFDGFAVDLWSAGVILYIMLTGFPPYDQATRADQRFEIIVEGQLVEQLRLWEINVSDEAGDLLQSMLRLDPRQRLTLAQVMTHPWVTNPDVLIPTPDALY
jgi:serine/threonine protein kinase